MQVELQFYDSAVWAGETVLNPYDILPKIVLKMLTTLFAYEKLSSMQRVNLEIRLRSFFISRAIAFFICG